MALASGHACVPTEDGMGGVDALVRSPNETVVTAVSVVITPEARMREMFSLAGKSTIAAFMAMKNNPSKEGRLPSFLVLISPWDM